MRPQGVRVHGAMAVAPHFVAILRSMAGVSSLPPQVSVMAQPLEIQLHKQSRQLDIAFDDGVRFTLPCEYLRVFSPSAEVRGHGPGQEVLVYGKEAINITSIDPVGHYAVRLVFDDGHDSGLYSWDYFYELGQHQAQNWADYLARLAAAGHVRNPQP